MAGDKQESAMGMNFIISATADVETDGDAEDFVDMSSIDARDLFDAYNVEFEDVEVEGRVTVKARATAHDIEVAAENLNGFDADVAVQEAIDPYGGTSASGGVFTIKESPTGFEEVALATDRDTAIEVYAALANAGFEVN